MWRLVRSSSLSLPFLHPPLSLFIQVLLEPRLYRFQTVFAETSRPWSGIFQAAWFIAPPDPSVRTAVLQAPAIDVFIPSSLPSLSLSRSLRIIFLFIFPFEALSRDNRRHLSHSVGQAAQRVVKLPTISWPYTRDLLDPRCAFVDLEKGSISRTATATPFEGWILYWILDIYFSVLGEFHGGEYWICIYILDWIGGCQCVIGMWKCFLVICF